MTDADLGKFFRSKLACDRQQVEPFVFAKIDPSCESYFLDVFEPEPIIVEEDMIVALMTIWREQG